MANLDHRLVFHDFLPAMMQKLGPHGFVEELAKAFDLLADPSTQTITLSSLRRGTIALGIPSMQDCELEAMMSLGCDQGAQQEMDLYHFCVAVVRSSPDLMQQGFEMLVHCAEAAKEEEGLP